MVRLPHGSVPTTVGVDRAQLCSRLGRTRYPPGFDWPSFHPLSTGHHLSTEVGLHRVLLRLSSPADRSPTFRVPWLLIDCHLIPATGGFSPLQPRRQPQPLAHFYSTPAQRTKRPDHGRHTVSGIVSPFGLISAARYWFLAITGHRRVFSLEGGLRFIIPGFTCPHYLGSFPGLRSVRGFTARPVSQPVPDRGFRPDPAAPATGRWVPLPTCIAGGLATRTGLGSAPPVVITSAQSRLISSLPVLRCFQVLSRLPLISSVARFGVAGLDHRFTSFGDPRSKRRLPSPRLIGASVHVLHLPMPRHHQCLYDCISNKPTVYRCTNIPDDGIDHIHDRDMESLVFQTSHCVATMFRSPTRELAVLPGFDLIH